MMPSVYNRSNLEKDTVIEDRDEVKVTFAGGNVWHVLAEGADKHETKRGATNAWKRAEAIRKDLNPDYTPPESEADEITDDSEAKADDDGKAEKPAKKPAKSKAAKSKGKGSEPGAEKEIMIGSVKGVSSMMPVSAVCDLLSDQAGRVSLLQGSSEARRLTRRVRATDGRCAPIFLTKQDMDDKKEVPALFDGLFSLACAINLDMKQICVVTLPSDEVSGVQGHIASMMQSSLSTDGDGDDDLMVRVNSDD